MKQELKRFSTSSVLVCYFTPLIYLCYVDESSYITRNDFIYIFCMRDSYNRVLKIWAVRELHIAHIHQTVGIREAEQEDGNNE